MNRTLAPSKALFGNFSEMNSNANFQQFEESDLQAVVAVERRVMPFGWNLNTFRPCLHNDAYECWKLEKDETLIGYCVLYFIGPTAQLLNLCVDVPHQRKGYGRDILHFALARCRAKGVQDLFLEVRSSNSVAQQLYHSLGFKKIGQRKDYYESTRGREHAEVYSLDLY